LQPFLRQIHGRFAKGFSLPQISGCFAGVDEGYG